MRKESILLGVIVAALFVAAGQPSEPPRVFTAAQAEAGRAAYERSCGKCHTLSGLGRKGDAGELPPIDSLSASYRKFIGARGLVPPLAGQAFLDKWGDKTAAQLIERFQVTADDPFFGFEDMNAETVVNITAYVLQVSGAKPGDQALTRSTDVPVRSLIR